MERLIVYLTAIAGLAKDLHYTVSGESFYGNHLLMDRIQDDLYDFVDEIKENYFMYLGREVPSAREIFLKSAELLEKPKTVGEKTRTLFEYMKDAVYLCDEEAKKEKYDCGDSDLLGRIASKMKNNVALLRKVVEPTGEG